METDRRRLFCSLLALVVLPVLTSAPAPADDRGGPQRKSPVQLRSSSVHRPPPGVPRNLTPPAGLGSATNVAPGFYKRLNTPQHGGGHGTGVGHPGVVYVLPGVGYPVVGTPYAVGPVQVGVDPVADHRSQRPSAPPEAVPAAPAPPPIIIVNQPPALPQPATQPAPAPRRPAAPPRPKPTQPMQVAFSVAPANATVYLDSELLGSGHELSAITEPLHLDPGVYVVEVTHPDHPSQRIVFGLGSKPVEVVVDLEALPPRRRSRVRQ